MAEDDGIRAREIDVLEDAHRVRALRQGMRRMHPVAINDDHLAGSHVALIACVYKIKGARLRRYNPCVLQAAQSERAKATWVAHGDEGFRRQKEHGERAFGLA